MTKHIAKPVDLIVANTMHRCVQRTEAAAPMVKMLIGAEGGSRSFEDALLENFARAILVDIASEADIAKVYAALKAVGAPCSRDDISEGRRAVLERAR